LLDVTTELSDALSSLYIQSDAATRPIDICFNRM
jgi:hypothetical protein